MAFVVKTRELWLCVDCTVAAVNGDFTGFSSDEQIAATERGLERIGPHLVPDFDSETGEGHEEFAHRSCDCCDSGLAGEYHRFAILAPKDPTMRGDGHGNNPDMFYLNPHCVLAKKDAPVPRFGQTRSGYGKRLPTGTMLKLTTGRWHRVKVILFSNRGSAYITFKGKPVYLGSYQP